MVKLTDKVYLAIDPGQENTGYAWFNDSGELSDNGSIRGGSNAFLDWLDEQPVAKIIMHETYRQRPGQVKRWSTNGTSKLIGSIERYAYKHKIKLETYEPANMYQGLRLLGMAGAYPRGTHVPDRLSALAGGHWCLLKLGIAQHVLSQKEKK